MARKKFDSLDRFYRHRHSASESWKTFRVVFRETDLWIGADKDLQKEAMTEILHCRRRLQAYIEENPPFLTSFAPLPQDPFAPKICRDMIEAAALALVGPMAAVAGAVAQHVGHGLRALTPEVIIENGGDCYLDMEDEVTVGLYAGPRSPFSNRLGLRFAADRFPLGVCTSSGTVGHSTSLGQADAVTVVSRSTALADAAATALGNLVRSPKDISAVLEAASKIEMVEGTVVIVGDKIGAWGNVELVPIG